MLSEKRNKAVFFDRDGTLNNNGDYYVYNTGRFRFNPGVEETLKILSEKGYLLFVVSNQSGISKELYNYKDADKVNEFMKEKLSASGVRLTDILYCTHHPDQGKCLCRKPESLLVERLVSRYSVDASKSFFVGDAQRDTDAGEKAGLRGILIAPNSDLRQILKIIP